MKNRVHNSPNLIYSVGTQVVALKQVQGSNGQAVHPAGAVGVEFHEREYERLVTELELAAEQSTLPERPSGRDALNDLLVQLRVNG
jgi:hypothetical protein